MLIHPPTSPRSESILTCLGNTSLPPKPKAEDRSSKNDGIHVVVVDDLGDVTGNAGQILETFPDLSKAKDAVSAVNAPQKTYNEDFIALNSANIFASANPSTVGLTNGNLEFDSNGGSSLKVVAWQ